MSKVMILISPDALHHCGLLFDPVLMPAEILNETRAWYLGPRAA